LTTTSPDQAAVDNQSSSAHSGAPLVQDVVDSYDKNGSSSVNSRLLEDQIEINQDLEVKTRPNMTLRVSE
jgi:hypothetical protein